MTKRINFLLLIIAAVAWSFSAKSQTIVPQKADTLVMKESDLVDFLKRLATETKRMEQTEFPVSQYSGNLTSRSTVDSRNDAFMQYRFDKIEDMLNSIMYRMGIPNNSSSRRDLILSQSSAGTPPVYPIGSSFQTPTRGTDELEKLQQQVDLLQKQMNLLISQMADKEAKSQMEAISKELSGIRQDLMDRKQETPVEKEIAEVRKDSVIVNNIETENFDNYKRQVFFRISSSDLTTEAVHTLRNVADVLKNNTDLNVEVIGYASPEGNAAFNTKLSAKRAQSVKQQLLKLGIDSKRVSVRTAGADSASDLKTYARRADIVVVK